MEESELYQALLNIVRESRLPQGMEKAIALAHAAEPYEEAVKACRRVNWTSLANLFTEKLGKLLDRKKLKPRHTGLILVLDETNLDRGAGIRVEAGVASRENDDYEWSAVPEIELGEIRLPALERLYEKIDAEWAWDIVVLYGFIGLSLQQALAQLGRERLLNGAEFRRILWGSHEGDPVFEFGDVSSEAFIPHLTYDDASREGEPAPELESPWAEDEALATGRAHDWLRLQCAACFAKRSSVWRVASELQQLCADLLRCGRKQDARRVVKLMAELAAGVKKPEDRAACWRSLCGAYEMSGDGRGAKAAERHGKDAAALIKDEQERYKWLHEYRWLVDDEAELAEFEPSPVLGGQLAPIEALVEKSQEAMRLELRRECEQFFDQALRGAKRHGRTSRKWNQFMEFYFVELAGVAAWLRDPVRLERLLELGTDEATGETIAVEAMLNLDMRTRGLAFVRNAIEDQRRGLAKKSTREKVERLVYTMPKLLEVLRHWGHRDEFLDAMKFYLRESIRGQRDPVDRVQSLAEAAKTYIRAGFREEFDDCIRCIRECGARIKDRDLRGLDKYQLIECFEVAGDWDAALAVAQRVRPPKTVDVEIRMYLARGDWKRLFHTIRARPGPRERAERYHFVATQLAPGLDRDFF